MMKLGEKVRTIRLQQNIKQIELAKLAKISNSYLSDIELGRVMPSIRTLEHISIALSTNISIFTNNNISTSQDLMQHTNKLQLQSLFSTVVDGVLVTDLQKKIIAVNKSFCDLTGFDKNYLIGRRVSKYISPMNNWKIHDLLSNINVNKIVFYEEFFNPKQNKAMSFRVNTQKIQLFDQAFLVCFLEDCSYELQTSVK